MQGIHNPREIDAALISEKMLIDYFQEQSKYIRTPLGKAVFWDMAQKGRTNFRRLYRLRRRLTGKVRVDEGSGQAGYAAATARGLEDLEAGLSGHASRAPDDSDDCSIIEAASSLVDKASWYFSRFSEALGDPEEKELFRTLAGMKREYFLNLKDIEEYLKNPGSWFAEMEHHGLDGA